jgi:Glycosyl transferase family 2
VAKRQYKAPDLKRVDTPVPWPKISVVTAVRNGEKYLEETIRSVIQQNYPNLEYIVIDGGSTDGTVEIIGKYQRELAGWVSEPDRGMYDALNKGFARTSGDVMGWLNASDQLQAGALRSVGGAFRAFPEVEWITGRPSWMSEQGVTYHVGEVQRWSRIRFLAGANRSIQQESTFWRRRLWERAGGYLDTTRGPVGDFDLWVRFFRHAQLYSVDALVGSYRTHKDSWGQVNLEECHRTQDRIVEEELARIPQGRWLRAFRDLAQLAMKLRGARYAWWKMVEMPLYRWKGPDLAPILRHSPEKGWWVNK